jgi:hypothetical protein
MEVECWRPPESYNPNNPSLVTNSYTKRAIAALRYSPIECCSRLVLLRLMKKSEAESECERWIVCLKSTIQLHYIR